MTEAEWLACADLEIPLRGGFDQLADLTGRPVSERKLRLFLVACARRVCHVFQDPRSLLALDSTEKFADGGLTREEMWREDEGIIDPPNPDCQEPATWPPQLNPGYCVHEALTHAGGVDDMECFMALQGAGWARDALGTGLEAREEAAQVVLLRDIFDNPFDPSPQLPPAILAGNDGTVPRLAKAIYKERQMPVGTLDTVRLAILADALLDAGCDDEALIHHCREPGPHVRGCWAVDLLLEKS